MNDVRYVSAIAGIALVGSFTLIGIYAWRNQDPNPAVLTLVTTIVTGLLGYFFGSRGVAQGIEKATNGMSNMAAQVASHLIRNSQLETQASEAATSSQPEGKASS